MTIVYADDPELSAEDFADLAMRAGEGARLPASDKPRLTAMVAGADIMVAARDSAAEGKLIAVVRAITDHVSCCYLADVIVDQGYANQSLRRELVEAVRRRLRPGNRVIMLAAPGGEAELEGLGFQRLPNAFVAPEPG